MSRLEETKIHWFFYEKCQQLLQTLPGRMSSGKILGSGTKPGPGLHVTSPSGCWDAPASGKWSFPLLKSSLVFFINVYLYLGLNYKYISEYFCSHELPHLHILKPQTHHKFSPGHSTYFPNATVLLLKSHLSFGWRNGKVWCQQWRVLY